MSGGGVHRLVIKMLEIAFQRKRTPPMIVLYATYLYLAGLAFGPVQIRGNLYMSGG